MSRSNAAPVISLDEYRRRREAERCRVETMAGADVVPALPQALPGVAWMPVMWVVGWWLPPALPRRAL